MINLIRVYLPKRLSSDDISNENLQEIVRKGDNCPGNALDYGTPPEAGPLAKATSESKYFAVSHEQRKPPL